MSLLPIRPPAVPLVVHDPFFSCWSSTDALNESWPIHWAGEPMGMAILARIDGKAYRLCGLAPREAEAAKQLQVEVSPTTTRYRFATGSVETTLSFVSPILPDDLDVLSRPLTYLEFEAKSSDGSEHSVEFYCDASAEWCVESDGERVEASRSRIGQLEAVRIGASDQRPLFHSGDTVRIGWGRLYLATPRGAAYDTSIASHGASRTTFVASGKCSETDDLNFPRAANDDWPVIAASCRLGKTGTTPKRALMILAFDDGESIEYLGRKLKAYWRKDGQTFGEMMSAGYRDFEVLNDRCAAFDDKLVADLNRVGGPKYATICALAYRQAVGAHKLVADIDGRPLLFSKENNSNGCIATVDVTYPSAPLFLAVQPKLLSAMLEPILFYAALPRWKWKFAPHDLGQYPLANGQVYGGGERTEVNQMPVEECGNMLILVEAVANVSGDLDIARRYHVILQTWADYLVENGLDPKLQLCTDDFSGHLARNANLSVKAILGIASYGKICARLGDPESAKKYGDIARDYARKWESMARDGDHYVLAFGQPNTWSQKYNLVWDRVLDLNVFPSYVAPREVAFYETKLNPFGLPLDNRAEFTKIDWELWTASLAGTHSPLFSHIVDRVFDWLDKTPSRVPMSDWYETKKGNWVSFRARSVVGGLFMPMLEPEARR